MVHAARVLTHPWVKNAIIHPFALAAFPILSLYARNMGKGFLDEAITITVGIILCTGLLWLLANLLVRNTRKSAIIVSVFVTIFFLYGHAISAAAELLERLQLLDGARFLVQGRSSLVVWLLIWSALFALVLWMVARVRSDLRTANVFLNIVSLALWVMLGASLATAAVDTFAMPGLSVAATQLSVPQRTAATAASEDQSTFEWAESGDSWLENASLPGPDATPESLPDIYYIVVDAYAGADILENVYQLDNSEFLSYLSGVGFYVSSESRSNYSQTALSLASSLNMIYLDEIENQIGSETDNRRPLRLMIQHNRLVRFLREHGYAVFASSTGYELTELTEADVFLAPVRWWTPGEFEEALIALTPLAAFQKTWSDFRRERILYAFEHLADAAETEGPAFVFVHVLAPHWPFIFDADGAPIEPPRGTGSRTDYEYDEFIESYRNQLLFVNKLLRASIDEILSQSSSPPIIIVQADHGPDAKLDFNWDIEGTYLPERMSILNALYLPGQTHEDLYDGITPVNTFRVVLNKYFDIDLELLPDRSYFSQWDHPYLFIDVTEAVTD
jgi:hypothetical protein